VQPSLVYAADGPSAQLFNQLAVLPVVALPRSAAPVQPMHVDDLLDGLVALLRDLPVESATVPFVGPRPMPLAEYVGTLRHAVGPGRRQWVLPVPPAWCMAAASVAGLHPASLLDRDAVRMLLRGNAADPAPLCRLIGRPLRDPADFIAPAEAASVRRAAVLQSAVPVLQASVAAVWIWTGLVSLGLYPVAGSMALLADFGLQGPWASAALYAGALLDLLLGVLVFTLPARWRPWLWCAQLALIAGYTLLITLRIPQWWLHPFGPISKNLPMLAVIGLLLALEPVRRRR
jgi:hypothetical protein